MDRVWEPRPPRQLALFGTVGLCPVAGDARNWLCFAQWPPDSRPGEARRVLARRIGFVCTGARPAFSHPQLALFGTIGSLVPAGLGRIGFVCTKGFLGPKPRETR